ncbi:DNA adenine methylase [Brevundimonas naejangsanensis]|uniref:DNA adenine methylase n=1 Tax=Brevundimonas naejangsanensis TaxID=588932 RepID=UPI0026F24A77|nr:DNA adenine methylase [Brevundimonas naejangsanensis]
MNCSRNVLYVAQRPVAAAEPPAAWLGGKRHLAKRICHVLASTPHDAYVEPFIGMGGVFLRRRVRPHVEVINDISGDIVTLFRVLQRFPEALLRELRWRPAMRSEFARLNEARDCDLLDIERAARFLYLQTLAFGGKMSGRSFGVSTKGAHNFDLTRLEPRLRRLHDRLAGVVIENLDWMDVIARYDRPGTLFYLDPPYLGGESDYGVGVFIRGDFQRMADKLRAIEGRFLLSINDRPEIRELFAWADMEAVQTTYSIAGGDKASTAAELLIGKGVELAPAAAQASLF